MHGNTGQPAEGIYTPDEMAEFLRRADESAAVKLKPGIKEFKLAFYTVTYALHPTTLAPCIEIKNARVGDLTKLSFLPVLTGPAASIIYPDTDHPDGIVYRALNEREQVDQEQRKHSFWLGQGAFFVIAGHLCIPENHTRLEEVFGEKGYVATLDAVRALAHRLTTYADDAYRKAIDLQRSRVMATTAEIYRSKIAKSQCG